MAQRGRPFHSKMVNLEIWTARSRLAQQRNHVDAYILRFYGNADRAERWAALDADAFGERAVEIWGMNYPGFGGSSGPARLKRMSPAAVAAFDALKSKAGNQPIYVFGASIGSAVAMDVAANRDVRGLILHNPPPLRQIILRHYGWWNLWLLAGPVALQIPPELDSVANAKRIHARGIFLLAENDEIVPPKFQRLVVDSFAGRETGNHLARRVTQLADRRPGRGRNSSGLRLVIWAVTPLAEAGNMPAWRTGRRPVFLIGHVNEETKND